MEMAKDVVERRGISIRLACEALFVSQNCYRYQPKLSDENAEITDWLVRLTHNKRNWGFGLCFLFLRNVKGFWMESQASLPNLAGVGTEPAN